MPTKRECQRSVYRGNPTIMIPIGKPEDDKWFSLGFWKAKAVVDHFDDIEAWVIDQEVKRGKK